MAVWALGLVICMWRYFDEGKNRYLYISSGLLALTFATKESAYLLVGTLGLWCVLVLAHAHFGRAAREGAGGRGERRDRGNDGGTARQPARKAQGQTRGGARGAAVFDSREARAGGVSPPVALARAANRLLGSGADFKLDLTNLVGPGGLPDLPDHAHAAAVVGVQRAVSGYPAWLDESDAGGAGGQPEDRRSGSGRQPHRVRRSRRAGALLQSISGTCGIGRFGGSARPSSIRLGRCCTRRSSPTTRGIKSGIWQALGYWVVQQGEGRGSQPWYYYFVVTSIYEFLPILIGAIAAVYYLRRRRRDSFDVFLVYWAMVTLVLYTIASEKMPWLVVGITLPFIALSGKFLADVAQRIDWRSSLRMSGYGYMLIPGVPLFLILLWNLVVYRSSGNVGLDVAIQLGIAAALGALVALLVYVSRSVGRYGALGVSLIALAVVLAALSLRAGVIASYRNGDTPVEMLVYTQTSPDVTRLLDELDRSEAGIDTPISIDSTSGFSWPWAWYFRDAEGATFPVYNTDSFDAEPYESVLLVHSKNRESADEMLSDTFSEAERIRHRWWFPEHVYRNMTPSKLASKMLDRSAWRHAAAYWLNREGVMDQVGSEDSYLYFKEDTPLKYQGFLAAGNCRTD